MKRKLLTETPVCPRERLVIISYTTGLSFAEERIGPLATIITTVFYLFALYLFALPNTPETPFASIYSETLIKTTSQHLLLLVGFDTLIYQKYYDTPPILVGHHGAPRWPWWPTGIPASLCAVIRIPLGDFRKMRSGADYVCFYILFSLSIFFGLGQIKGDASW
jgi:hypothetical protein